MSEPVTQPIQSAMPATVGHMEAVTDNQTTALKLAGWIRTGVAAIVILLGMVGVQVTFKQAPPTPPDQGLAALVELLKAQQKPAPVAAPKLTLAEVMARLEEIKAEQSKK